MSYVTQVFNSIYEEKKWAEEDGTRSGSGSTHDVNRTRCLFLAYATLSLGVRTVFDICGDCNWQRGFMDLLPHCQYVGMDVASHALQRAKERCSSNMRIVPVPVDVAEDELRRCIELPQEGESLFLVKEVIQHLPLEKGKRLIRNIKESGVRYLAITHHDPQLFPSEVNLDVPCGEFYHNNMFAEPFNFRYPILDVANFLPEPLRRTMGNLIVFDLHREVL